MSLFLPSYSARPPAFVRSRWVLPTHEVRSGSAFDTRGNYNHRPLDISDTASPFRGACSTARFSFTDSLLREHRWHLDVVRCASGMTCGMRSNQLDRKDRGSTLRFALSSPQRSTLGWGESVTSQCRDHWGRGLLCSRPNLSCLHRSERLQYSTVI